MAAAAGAVQEEAPAAEARAGAADAQEQVAALACEEAATASLSPDGWHGQNVSSNNLILEHFKPSIFVPSETKHIRGDYQSVFYGNNRAPNECRLNSRVGGVRTLVSENTMHCYDTLNLDKPREGMISI